MYMFTAIHKPLELPGGDNKASCVNLVEYLTKEDGYFFNGDRDNITSGEAIELIDDNSVGLKKNDTKFFMLTLNPSQAELRHLAGRKVGSISELTEKERKIYHEKLQSYTQDVMNLYADQFDRQVNGRKLTGDDLVYIAKIEESRHYDFNEKIPTENRAILREIENCNDRVEIENLKAKLHRDSAGDIIKTGDEKEGLQTHIHIVVSRYDKTKQTKLSPLANSRGYSDKHQAGGKNVKVGFSRLEFKLACEKAFDDKFGYNRKDYEKTVYTVQQNRNRRGMNLSNALYVINKEGQIDPINAIKFAYYAGRSIVNGAPIGLTPATLSKIFIDKISPVQVKQVTNTKKKVLKVIKTGGLDV